MASTKKSVILEEEIVDEEVATVEEVVVTKPARKVNKPKHDPSELIACKSVRFGELILIGPKTRMPYSWANEGDVNFVEYQDLLAWRTLHSRYLYDPMIIIEDEELCAEWTDLEKLYSEIEVVDLKELFGLPHRQFVARLKKLPEGMKSSVQNMAYAMIQDGTLYDLRTIKTIDETLGTELKMMI